MKCKLCGRDAVSGLCPHHEAARVSVMSAYAGWVNAYGALGWAEYLERIVGNGETGEWAREVARMLLDSGEVEEAGQRDVPKS